MERVITRTAMSLIATVEQRPTDFSGGVAPYALDPEYAERLWDVALKLIG